MKIINLTGHAFSLYDTDGALISIEPDPRYVGLVAVGDHTSIEDGAGHRFSLNVRRIRGIKGMPEPEEGVVFVVSNEVAMALQEDREDIAYLAEDADMRAVDGTPQRLSHLRRTVRAFPVEA